MVNCGSALMRPNDKVKPCGESNGRLSISEQTSNDPETAARLERLVGPKLRLSFSEDLKPFGDFMADGPRSTSDPTSCLPTQNEVLAFHFRRLAARCDSLLVRNEELERVVLLTR